jgi:hypothetical protein
MRNSIAAAIAFVVTLGLPVRADAWGYAGHRLIMERAIALLPPELKPFFEKHRVEVVVRVVDPDQWRLTGWDDDPNHFLDFGAREYGEYPFEALPREYDKALEKFGMTVLKRNGLLPWREMEMYGYLRRTFEELKRESPYTVSNLVLFAPVASHYLQDAHQPFHATDNYDGQLTGQAGIHSRFERDLIERYGARLQLRPAPAATIASVRDFMFETLLKSYQRTAPILQADKEAIAGKDAYDDAYFEAFFTKVKPVLEQSLSESITATASLIVTAWEAAGRPAVRLDDVRPVQRVRPAR